MTGERSPEWSGLGTSNRVLASSTALTVALSLASAVIVSQTSVASPAPSKDGESKSLGEVIVHVSSGGEGEEIAGSRLRPLRLACVAGDLGFGSVDGGGDGEVSVGGAQTADSSLVDPLEGSGEVAGDGSAIARFPAAIPSQHGSARWQLAAKLCSSRSGETRRPV